MSATRIDAIFRTLGTRWGLRGDPILWDAIRMRVMERGLPETAAAFGDQLAQDYADIVGQPLGPSNDFIRVKSVMRDNGGMSNGMVAPQAWREGLMPLLMDRFNENA